MFWYVPGSNICGDKATEFSRTEILQCKLTLLLNNVAMKCLCLLQCVNARGTNTSYSHTGRGYTDGMTGGNIRNTHKLHHTCLRWSLWTNSLASCLVGVKTMQRPCRPLYTCTTSPMVAARSCHGQRIARCWTLR
jgi:hypothetical protein